MVYFFRLSEAVLDPLEVLKFSKKLSKMVFGQQQQRCSIGLKLIFQKSFESIQIILNKIFKEYIHFFNYFLYNFLLYR